MTFGDRMAAQERRRSDIAAAEKDIRSTISIMELDERCRSGRAPYEEARFANFSDAAAAARRLISLLTVAVYWALADHLYVPGPGMGEPGLDPHWHDWADLADASKHGRFAGPAKLARVAMGVHRG